MTGEQKKVVIRVCEVLRTGNRCRKALKYSFRTVHLTYFGSMALNLHEFHGPIAGAMFVLVAGDFILHYEEG